MLQSCPEKPIDRVQGTRPFPFEDGDLLPKGENFKGRVTWAPEEDADRGEETEYVFGRNSRLYHGVTSPRLTNGSKVPDG